MITPLAFARIVVFVALCACAAACGTERNIETADAVAVRDAVRLACDLAHAIAAETSGASIQRSSGVFTDEALSHPVRGCHVTIEGSFADVASGGDAASRLRDGFTARGWQEMLEYSADGEDGTAFVLRKSEIACLFRGSWTGGVDGEPVVPREGAYGISVLCTSPAPPEERRR